jgi:hypothetical protein
MLLADALLAGFAAQVVQGEDGTSAGVSTGEFRVVDQVIAGYPDGGAVADLTPAAGLWAEDRACVVDHPAEKAGDAVALPVMLGDADDGGRLAEMG